MGEASRLLSAHKLRGAPVVAGDGEFVGVLSADGSQPEVNLTAQAVADRTYPTVPSGEGLDFALDVIVSADAGWVPVLDGSRVVGIIAMNEVIGGYQHALRRSLRLLADVTGGSVLVEAPVGEASAFAGTTVATAPWPRGSVALSIDRRSQLIAPRPETELLTGDVVMAVVPAASEAELRRRLDGGPPP
jgi:CBS-domain-containing membrane protein